jgi:two-component system, NarL family, invasion response regulator UvrY
MADVRVLVAEDHPLITQALASELKPYGIDASASVADGNLVLTRYAEVKPDVLVLDLRLGQIRGLDVARELLQVAPAARIVFYSQFDQPHIVQEAYRLGAKAFVPKSADPQVLAEAIIAASHDGPPYFTPEIAAQLAIMSVRGEDSPRAKLTERELVVFQKMAQGRTIAEIAEDMQLSSKTVGLITQEIRQKLRVDRPAEITKLAIRYQLIDE